MKTKKYFFILMCFIFILSSFFVQAKTQRHVREFSKIKMAEPDYAQVVFAYFEQKGLSKSYIEKIKKRMKVAPYFPTVYVGYDHSLREKEGLNVTDNISVSSGDITIGPEDNDYNYYDYLGRTIRVRAVWKLDEIIYNKNHLLIESEKRELIKLQHSLSKELYSVFEERYLFLIKYLQAKNHHQRKAMYYAKYMSLTDKLDSLTGGLFSKRWWRGK